MTHRDVYPGEYQRGAAVVVCVALLRRTCTHRHIKECSECTAYCCSGLVLPCVRYYVLLTCVALMRMFGLLHSLQGVYDCMLCRLVCVTTTLRGIVYSCRGYIRHCVTSCILRHYVVSCTHGVYSNTV